MLSTAADRWNGEFSSSSINQANVGNCSGYLREGGLRVGRRSSQVGA